jgi:hypothetical protein
MTARFAYRRARTPAKAPAAAKPTDAPALPAAPLPKDPLPAQKDAFKKVCVYTAGGVRRTTISIPMGEYQHMLSFAGESDEAVSSACLAASKVLAAERERTWSETVSSAAMLELMCAFQSQRKAKAGRNAK